MSSLSARLPSNSHLITANNLYEPTSNRAMLVLERLHETLTQVMKKLHIVVFAHDALQMS
jgi:hypothetical protein